MMYTTGFKWSQNPYLFVLRTVEKNLFPVAFESTDICTFSNPSKATSYTQQTNNKQALAICIVYLWVKGC